MGMVKDAKYSLKGRGFLYGIGSVLNLGGDYYGEISGNPIKSDLEALKGDWEAIGFDIKNSLEWGQ